MLPHNLTMSGLDGRLDLDTGHISGGRTTERHLSELEDVFENEAARRTLVTQGDRLVYRVSSVEAAQGDGDLHYGLGWIAPGKVGEEYHLTRGHLHAWRPAAEVYVGLRGEGLMLLEDEQGAQSRSVPLAAGQVVYVPGHTPINPFPCPSRKRQRLCPAGRAGWIFTRRSL